MSSFLVTGAAGFIGSTLCAHLKKSGIRFIGVDDLSTGVAKNEVLNNGWVIDCSNYAIRDLVLEYNPTHIVHLAGQSSAEKSHEDPVNDLTRNVVSTSNLLNIARELRSLESFSLASSMAIYGDCCNANETTCPNPISFYGMHKLMAEQELRQFAKEMPLTSCNSMRLSNTYGIGQDLAEMKQGMVSIFVAMAVSKGFITVRGPLERTRTFIHIDDVVNAIILLSARISTGSPGSNYLAVNVCSADSITVRDLVNRICSLTGASFIVDEARTTGDQTYVTGDNALLRAITEWKQNKFITSSLDDVVKWANSAVGHV